MGKTIVVFALCFFFCSSYSFAQQAPSVPGQLLVKYTPEAANILYKGVDVTPVSSVGSKVLRYVLRFFWLNPSERNESSSDIQKKSETIKEQLGISTIQPLSRKLPSSRSIQLGTDQFFPSQQGTVNDPLQRTYVVTFSKGTMEEAIQTWKQSGLVDSVQPNYVYTINAVPNDPEYSRMWAHTRIRSEQAWDITTGSASVIVAIVDSGVDYQHTDLAGNMWMGDTGQGQGHGYDFVSDDADPMDEFGHGTFVAGIVGAMGNNGQGIVGVNWQTKIMAVRVLDPQGGGTTSTVSQGIRFAADHGAKIINISLGQTFACGQTDPTLDDSIKYATGKGTLIVAAAGNSNHNAACDSPANVPEVLVVSARGSQDEKSRYSNYGIVSWKQERIISAPGGNASNAASCTQATCPLSSRRGGGVTLNQGTSFASPYVAGVAALVLSKQSMTPLVLRAHLVSTADDIGDDFTTQVNPSLPGDDGKRTTGKRVNAHAALVALSIPTQTPVPTFTPVLTPTISLTLSPTRSPTVSPTAVPSPTTGLTLTPPVTVSPTAVPGATGTAILSPTQSVNPSPRLTVASTPTITISPAPEDVSIWVLIRKNGKTRRVKENAKVKKGTKIAICYDRAAGPYTITVDTGKKKKVKKGNARRAAKNRCLTSGGSRFVPVGEYARADGAIHRFTIESGGKTASVGIRVFK